MYNDYKISLFLEKLQSDSPVPGGGACAGLAGCVGASLLNMVFSLTIDKKAYREASDDIKTKINHYNAFTKEVCNELLKLMDKDSEEFLNLMEVFKLPKNTEEEKNKRNLTLNESYKTSLLAPLNILRESFKLYEVAEFLMEYGNKNLISDVLVGVSMIQSAMESAAINVKINLKYLKEEDYKLNVLKELNELLAIGESKKSEIFTLGDKYLI